MSVHASSRLLIGVPFNPEDMFQQVSGPYKCYADECPTIAGGGKERPPFCSQCGLSEKQYTAKQVTWRILPAWAGDFDEQEWDRMGHKLPLVEDKPKQSTVDWNQVFNQDENDLISIKGPCDVFPLHARYGWGQVLPHFMFGMALGRNNTGHHEVSTFSELDLTTTFSQVSTEAEKRGLTANPVLYLITALE